MPGYSFPSTISLTATEGWGGCISLWSTTHELSESLSQFSLFPSIVRAEAIGLIFPRIINQSTDSINRLTAGVKGPRR